MLTEIDLRETLPKEKYFITGTHVYGLPNYKPEDIDVCILCEDASSDYHRITEKIAKLGEIAYIKDYEQPFSWGGTTYGRMKIDNLDIFLVGRKTFEAIFYTTQSLRAQPLPVKELLKKKIFRIEMFQMIARRFMTTAQ